MCVCVCVCVSAEPIVFFVNDEAADNRGSVAGESKTDFDELTKTRPGHQQQSGETLHLLFYESRFQALRPPPL